MSKRLKVLFLFIMFDDLKKTLNRAINLDDSEAFRFAVNDDVKKLIVHLNTVIQLGEFGNNLPIHIDGRNTFECRSN